MGKRTKRRYLTAFLDSGLEMLAEAHSDNLGFKVSGDQVLEMVIRGLLKARGIHETNEPEKPPVVSTNKKKKKNKPDSKIEIPVEQERPVNEDGVYLSDNSIGGDAIEKALKSDLF